MSKKIFLFFLLFTGCKCMETFFPEKNLFIKSKNDLVPVVYAGNLKVIKTLDSFKIVNIQFDKVRGGYTDFLGIEFNKHDGYKYKRLILKQKNQVINRYSIEDILKFKTEIIDSMIVYDLPQ